MNHFATFGLDPRFDLDEAALAEKRVQFRADPLPDKAGIDAAYHVLSDRQRRAEHLFDLIGGDAGNDHRTLPPGFRETFDALRIRRASFAAGEAVAAAAELDAERQRRLSLVGKLFGGLRQRDNPVVQRDRRRTLRIELNALRELRSLQEAPADAVQPER